MESSDGSDWREKFVETAPFYTNKQISNFISETEVSHKICLEKSTLILRVEIKIEK